MLRGFHEHQGVTGAGPEEAEGSLVEDELREVAWIRINRAVYTMLTILGLAKYSQKMVWGSLEVSMRSSEGLQSQTILITVLIDAICLVHSNFLLSVEFEKYALLVSDITLQLIVKKLSLVEF